MKLGTMIADTALRFPEREAIVCEERRINFGQLKNTANMSIFGEYDL